MRTNFTPPSPRWPRRAISTPVSLALEAAIAHAQARASRVVYRVRRRLLQHQPIRESHRALSAGIGARARLCVLILASIGQRVPGLRPAAASARYSRPRDSIRPLGRRSLVRSRLAPIGRSAVSRKQLRLCAKPSNSIPNFADAAEQSRRDSGGDRPIRSCRNGISRGSADRAHARSRACQPGESSRVQRKSDRSSLAL